MKEYKLIYMPYLLGPLIGSHDGDNNGDTGCGFEASELNSVVNGQAVKGWVVKNSGIIEDTSAAERVIFWVLLERDVTSQASEAKVVLVQSR